MMERMLLSKFRADDLAVMNPSAFREEADLLSKEYTKIQAIRQGMQDVDTACDDAIARYVMVKLRRINAERLEMPNLAMASDDTIAHYVMGTLTAIIFASVDQLTAKSIQRLPPDHRLRNFHSHIPACLEEIDNSASRAGDNKQTTRPAHLLRIFGISRRQPIRRTAPLSICRLEIARETLNVHRFRPYSTTSTGTLYPSGT